MSYQSVEVGGSGGDAFSFECPDTSYLTTIAGRSGSWLDGISAECSDGTKFTYRGGTGGAAWEEKAASGFDGVNLVGDTYVMGLQLKQDGVNKTMHGGGVGPQKVDFACPQGSKMHSISGKAGRFLDRVAFGCRAPETAADPIPVGDVDVAEESTVGDTYFGMSKTTLIIIIITVIVAVVAAIALAIMLRRPKRTGAPTSAP